MVSENYLFSPQKIILSGLIDILFGKCVQIYVRGEWLDGGRMDDEDQINESRGE